MFIFDLDPHLLFKERENQFYNWGIPPVLVRQAKASITNMWSADEGGWTVEWSRLATYSERRGDWLTAALLYTAGIFPVINTEERFIAQKKQIDCFQKASKHFKHYFERRFLEIPYGGRRIQMPVHIYGTDKKGLLSKPYVFLTAGTDTTKFSLHRVATILSKLCSANIVVFDMPGTGESNLPLRPDCDEVYYQVMQTVVPHDNSRTAVFGISFGGHWAAKLALQKRVDVAINLGGPVGLAERSAEDIHNLPYGMSGILANIYGLNELPGLDFTQQVMNELSLAKQGLFTEPPSLEGLFVINGEMDQYIPKKDTTGFAEFCPNVFLVRNATHCAAERIKRVLPYLAFWLRERLHGRTLLSGIGTTLSEIPFKTAVYRIVVHGSPIEKKIQGNTALRS